MHTLNNGFIGRNLSDFLHKLQSNVEAPYEGFVAEDVFDFVEKLQRLNRVEREWLAEIEEGKTLKHLRKIRLSAIYTNNFKQVA